MSVNQEEKKKKPPAFLLFSHNPIVFQSEGNPGPISKTNCFNNKAAGGFFFNEKGAGDLCRFVTRLPKYAKQSSILQGPLCHL